METYNMEIKNAGPVLTELLTAIQSFDDWQQVYVSSLGSTLSAFAIKELPLPGILSILGIRSLTLNASYDLEPLCRLQVTAGENRLQEFFKDEAVVQALRLLFNNCHTIAFDDWSTLSGASVLWHELLTNVIKPLGKADLRYIFYLGDPIEKFSFEVDEVLEIIGDFSLHGKATFALDENEAIKLWKVLNGVAPDMLLGERSFSDLKKKYFSIFRTMNIAYLLVYSANDAILYAHDQQFVLSRKKVAHDLEIASNARQNFIAGYSIGLLTRLDMAHCIALGLIVFGFLVDLKPGTAQKDMIAYIQNWIEDLQKTDEVQLYRDY